MELYEELIPKVAACLCLADSHGFASQYVVTILHNSLPANIRMPRLLHTALLALLLHPLS
jgi:hypothetical protein